MTNGIICFTAAYCVPCKAVKEILSNMSGITIQYVNIEKNPDMTTEYGVTSIPTVFTIKDTKIVNKYVGIVKKEKLLKDLE